MRAAAVKKNINFFFIFLLTKNRAYLFLSYINKMVSHLYVNVNEYEKIKNSKKVLTYKNKYSIILYKINMGKIMETL